MHTFIHSLYIKYMYVGKYEISSRVYAKNLLFYSFVWKLCDQGSITNPWWHSVNWFLLGDQIYIWVVQWLLSCELFLLGDHIYIWVIQWLLSCELFLLGDQIYIWVVQWLLSRELFLCFRKFHSLQYSGSFSNFDFIPAVAVASGSSIFIYKNMRPYFKFTLPSLEVDEREDDIWKQVQQVVNWSLDWPLTYLHNKSEQLYQQSLFGMYP
jgi:hypothetical protein